MADKIVKVLSLTRSQVKVIRELIAIYYDNFIGEAEGKFLDDVKALDKMLGGKAHKFQDFLDSLSEKEAAEMLVEALGEGKVVKCKKAAN